MGDYQHMGRVISDVEDWSPPQPEKRVCGCGVIISRYNSEDFCNVCLRKQRLPKEAIW